MPAAYGVFNLFGDGLASASVFLIDKSGSVVWKDIGNNYRHQVSARTIIEQLVYSGAIRIRSATGP